MRCCLGTKKVLTATSVDNMPPTDISDSAGVPTTMLPDSMLTAFVEAVPPPSTENFSDLRAGSEGCAIEHLEERGISIKQLEALMKHGP